MGKILDMSVHGKISGLSIFASKNPYLYGSIKKSVLVHTIVECSVPAMPGDGGDLTSFWDNKKGYQYQLQRKTQLFNPKLYRKIAVNVAQIQDHKKLPERIFFPSEKNN